MFSTSLLRAALVAGPILANPMFGPLPVMAGESGDYAATFKGEITKQEAWPLDNKGHVVVAQVSQGTNTSTGKTEWMNGAQIVWSETVEIAGGNGPQNGLITIVKDGMSVTSSYTGALKTVMADGRPMTTGSGTWTVVSSSGGEAKGSGTYAITMTSPTTFEGEWKGDASASFAKAGTN